jgi:succinate dehydrogenase / fumarate reductase iron-sulfur subunit
MSSAVLENAPTASDAVPTFTATLIIRRFDPEVDDEPRWQDFDVQVLPTDRVLDALHQIKWEQDGSLTFRRSCAHGVCGSDAMRINGRNRLACKTLIKDLDLTQPIYVEAIKGLPLEKDLVVDMEPFFQSYREIQPFLMASSKPEKERIQSATQRERFDDTTKCILCAACTSSCPVFWTAGPPSSTRTASSSTPATRAPRCASTSSTTKRECGAAARPSTAPRPAPAASRSRRRSPRSRTPSCAAESPP